MKKYRKGENGGGLFSALEHEQAVARKTTGILKLRDLIDRESFRPLLKQLAGYAERNWSKGGQPPFDPVLMFTVLVLQKYLGLSDDATGEQIFDRASFKSFLGPARGRGHPGCQNPVGLQAANRSRRARRRAAALCGLWSDAGGPRAHRPRRQHR